MEIKAVYEGMNMKNLKSLVEKAYDKSTYKTDVCIRTFCEEEGHLFKVEIRKVINTSKTVLVTRYLDENCLVGELIGIYIIKSFFLEWFDLECIKPEDYVVTIFGTEVDIDVAIVENALIECITNLYLQNKWHDNETKETTIKEGIWKDE